MTDSQYARCNFDGRPLHPADQQQLRTFMIWLRMDGTDRKLAVRLDPEWQRFILGETLAERKAGYPPVMPPESGMDNQMARDNGIIG